MSSAASRPPFSASQSLGQATAGLGSSNAMLSNSTSAQSSDVSPPKRPQLMGPPARPKPPKPAPEPAPVVPEKPPEPETPQLIGPISKPSERMQYRAIGLLKGKYVASEEQFNRGDILLEDDTLIDSVLLGRVTSLIKKHIDLETNHLWVVYPRTLYKEEDNEPALHMQIVGVWEPETLGASKGKDADSDDDANPSAPRYLSTVEATDQCDRFSIRGEIAKYSEETSEITVNIVQKSKSENVKPKRPFKLLISGTLTGRTTGYFWDFKVKREGGQLILQEATQVAVVPPKKKSKDARRDGGRKRATGKPRSASSAPKPMPKKKKAEGEAHKAGDASASSTELEKGAIAATDPNVESQVAEVTAAPEAAETESVEAMSQTADAAKVSTDESQPLAARSEKVEDREDSAE